MDKEKMYSLDYSKVLERIRAIQAEGFEPSEILLDAFTLGIIHKKTQVRLEAAEDRENKKGYYGILFGYPIYYGPDLPPFSFEVRCREPEPVRKDLE